MKGGFVTSCRGLYTGEVQDPLGPLALHVSSTSVFACVCFSRYSDCIVTRTLVVPHSASRAFRPESVLSASITPTVTQSASTRVSLLMLPHQGRPIHPLPELPRLAHLQSLPLWPAPFPSLTVSQHQRTSENTPRGRMNTPTLREAYTPTIQSSLTSCSLPTLPILITLLSLTPVCLPPLVLLHAPFPTMTPCLFHLLPSLRLTLILLVHLANVARTAPIPSLGKPPYQPMFAPPPAPGTLSSDTCQIVPPGSCIREWIALPNFHLAHFRMRGVQTRDVLPPFPRCLP